MQVHCGLHAHLFDSTLGFNWDTALSNLFAGRRRKLWFDSITGRYSPIQKRREFNLFMVQGWLTTVWITYHLLPGRLVGSEEDHASNLSSHERSVCSIALSLLAQEVRSQDSPRRKSKTDFKIYHTCALGGTALE